MTKEKLCYKCGQPATVIITQLKSKGLYCNECIDDCGVVDGVVELKPENEHITHEVIMTLCNPGSVRKLLKIIEDYENKMVFLKKTLEFAYEKLKQVQINLEAESCDD